MNKHLKDAIGRLPDALRPEVWDALARHPCDLPADSGILHTLPKVWACSEFVARACTREPTLLTELADSGDLTTAYPEDGHRTRLWPRLSAAENEEALQREIRRFREREMVRIAWRDLAGWAALEETLLDLSRLAEVCIDEALTWLHRWLQERWGTPRSAEGELQRLVVLGMGKLGGEELNFSSDVDLIFAYPEAGETDGPRPSSNEEFFTRLGRELIAALDRQTADGQAYRVDMRLRPYGNSGPLAMSFAAMELYYQNHGREWERYAMIKARVVGGDHARGDELLAALRPFVYRRYLDYGALESLREMKALVAREVRRKGLADNIKLGRGGIREIEFIGQAFQLIRGGQDRALQQRRLLPVLDHLAEHRQLPGFARDELVAAYRFLRRTENRLQAIADRQVHELPEDRQDRARLAFAMDHESWEGFLNALEIHRRKVHEHFERVFEAPQRGDEPEAEALDLGDVWRGAVGEDAEADALLADAGFADPAAARRRLRALRKGGHVRSLSARGRARVDRLMPMLLNAAGAAEHPDATLERLVLLLDTIARRTAYLSLLNEHPMALSQLVQLCSGSAWIARLLTRHPILLDELLDPRTLYAPLRRQGLEQELATRLEGVAADDIETQMEVLRQFRQANTLRVAAADVSGAVPLMVVSDYLTDIAEVVLAAALRIAWDHVVGRHGRPLGMVDGEPVEQGFVILAYGKLGSIELGYGSDLDLVFLHEARGEQQMTDGERPVDNAVFFARLAQRLIHILTTPTPGGILYEVDTRLRPGGKSGLLTVSLDAFADYQRSRAWTWEHQALVRARVVAGSPALAEAVAAVRAEVVGRERDPDALRREVVAMRERMRREKGAKDAAVFDLKQDRGGIADIEFMVQYGILAGAHENPGLLRYTDNIRLLDALARGGWIEPEKARELADVYRAYRARAHRLTLQEQPARVAAEPLSGQRELVTALWRARMAPEAAPQERQAGDSRETGG